ncbi:AAA-like domain protein [compost metagenome]
MVGLLITIFIVLTLGLAAGSFIFSQYRKTLREAKNYERGLKMIPLLIHLPPSSDDLQGGGRDERDITEEVLSQGQVMYNIIASTATKGFKSRMYGQRHLSFEIISHKGLVHYYAVVPSVLEDVVRQAIAAAYPSARLEEVAEHNIFSQVGKMSGTIGGEFTLKKEFVHPIATYQETKRDAARALLNALSAAGREDGVAVQLMLRPAQEGWTKRSIDAAGRIKKDKGVKKASVGGLLAPKGLMEALWKPPEANDVKPEDKQLTSLEQALVDSIEEKTRYPGYEVLIRVVVSSNTAVRSQALLKNIVAAFSLFDSSTNNGFKFSLSKNIEELVTAYVFRFFPQTVTQNILNSVELATVFHLPDQSSIPTSQVQRQMAKQVDGPTHVTEEGVLLGYNEFRGTKKQIRLSTGDRRRHTYMIGQTGTGKSVSLENLAYQDMMDGRGFAFIDPHGDSAEELLGMVPKERVEDVIYFSPGDMDNPIGLNLFEFENQDQRDFLIQETIAMLYRLYDPGHTGIIGPRYEHWFRNAALTIMSDPNGSTFIDVPQVFNDQSFTDEKMKYITDRTVLDFWNKEMAQTSEANKSEVLGWFVSKFGAFLSNEMMRNIIGQTKSGFNLRDIMDNKKILLVNLSKGRTGELNSQLLGMIFVMKFQAAAMGRADMPADQREDFCLYVDEFQNFATDSFESILSEARKYKLNLVLANQFMTQLTDKIREAIIGNVGTVISGRIGITDAEILQKKFSPTFDAEDLTKLPNFQTVASVMINNVPSAPFSMSLIPPMGKSNPQLRDALKRLSAAKYGRPRAQVEKEIFARLGAGDAAKRAKVDAMKKVQQQRMAGAAPKTSATGSSFLDDWLAKRQQMGGATPKTQAPQSFNASGSAPRPVASATPRVPGGTQSPQPPNDSRPPIAPVAPSKPLQGTPPPSVDSQPGASDISPPAPASNPDKLHLRGEHAARHDEISIKLR